MKILKRQINGRGVGSVKLEAEEDDDMYHLYNLIAKGDMLEAFTVRNVIIESKSGARDKNRVQTRMTIEVVSVEFDAEQCSLRVNGMNAKENPHIKMGQHHCIELELNRSFELQKENWDSAHLELLDDASDPTKEADIAALVMQEGLAHLCLIKSALTKTCAKIEYVVGKKKPNYSSKGNQLDKTTAKFFENMYNSVKRHVNFETIKVVLVGSPGTLNDDFIKYLLDRSVREEDTAIIKNKSKFLRAATTTGTRKAIEEMLSSPDLLRQLTNVKAADEVKALNNFVHMFTADPSRVAYGLEAVTSASNQQAIAELLITDKVYRTDDFVARNKFVDLVEAVKAAGGAVYKFSSMHVSGEKLDLYTGLAATLRFSVEVADVEERVVQPPGQTPEARRKRSDSKAAKESEDFSSLMEDDEGGI